MVIAVWEGIFPQSAQFQPEDALECFEPDLHLAERHRPRQPNAGGWHDSSSEQPAAFCEQSSVQGTTVHAFDLCNERIRIRRVWCAHLVEAGNLHRI
jgi:hypothetical protein